MMGTPPGGLSCTVQFSPRLDLELIDEVCNKQVIGLVFLFLTLRHMENLGQPAAISGMTLIADLTNRCWKFWFAYRTTYAVH